MIGTVTHVASLPDAWIETKRKVLIRTRLNWSRDLGCKSNTRYVARSMRASDFPRGGGDEPVYV